ncbi:MULTISPECIES: Hsp20/alpha crystallin family protein [Bradyrhizobium]|uniref:Hsp20/alpha crystallin family protein n=1 Tax=Bradyrhizobium elkanii TaxID=29448 RepID=A0A4U6RZ64_BRAEL|nr:MULTISPECIES: Hsp20/alpha crystallin family protein [Bradyrhizobium]MTV12083.1 Hsp20/alpha crystallin family protein [Bradyrhizobium sp. BR2003]MTV12132.1 Hsp20/alpha crystallin family protein [Bradyrhizobium sp. BR2003]TKV79663.1 Hsp20/alpha crystallin family protein [Bradyrhizobium elkanii]
MAAPLPVSITQQKSLVARPNVDFASSLHREIERIFDTFPRDWPSPDFRASPGLTLNMDIAETDKDIEITAELPGLEQKDVQVNVADDVLTIKGEKKAEKEENDKNYHRIERSYGSFYRSLQLPSGVNADAIKASLKNGVLKVTVTKPAAALPQKIEVKAAA